MRRDTSAESHRINETSGLAASVTKQILDCVGNQTKTRRQIAEETGLPTATVSGLVTPMIERGDLEELAEKKPCPISGRKAYFVRRLMGQYSLI